MPTIQKAPSSFSISNHAFTRIAERLSLMGMTRVALKNALAAAVKDGKYIYRDPERNNNVFQCWLETDSKKREELFVVVADDGCVVTVIDQRHVFKNRAVKWGIKSSSTNH